MLKYIVYLVLIHFLFALAFANHHHTHGHSKPQSHQENEGYIEHHYDEIIGVVNEKPSLIKRDNRAVIRTSATTSAPISTATAIATDNNDPYLIGYLDYGNVTDCTTGTRVRPEVHDLTPKQLDTYLSAVVMCQQKKLDPNDPNSPSVYEQFCVQHHEYNAQNHGTAFFLPYHRIMLLDYENMLRSCGPDPNLVIPYFNWSILAASPWLDPVFSPRWFGDANRTEKCGSLGCCVGSNATYMLPEIMIMNNISSDMNADGDTCLKRGYTFGAQNGQYGLYMWISIINMIKSTVRFGDFASRWEVWHGALHMWVSGTMATMVSPFDPLFMLHHAYIDHVWYKWQELQDPYYSNFNGLDYLGNPVFLNSSLTPYSGITVQDTLNLTSLCVAYNSTKLLNLINPSQKLPDYIPINITQPPRLSDSWINDNNLDSENTQTLENATRQDIQNLQNLINLLVSSGQLTINGVPIQSSASATNLQAQSLIVSNIFVCSLLLIRFLFF